MSTLAEQMAAHREAQAKLTRQFEDMAERRAVIEALNEAGLNWGSGAAKLLGISRDQLKTLIKTHKLVPTWNMAVEEKEPARARRTSSSRS